MISLLSWTILILVTKYHSLYSTTVLTNSTYAKISWVPELLLAVDGVYICAL